MRCVDRQTSHFLVQMPDLFDGYFLNSLCLQTVPGIQKISPTKPMKLQRASHHCQSHIPYRELFVFSCGFFLYMSLFSVVGFFISPVFQDLQVEKMSVHCGDKQCENAATWEWVWIHVEIIRNHC